MMKGSSGSAGEWWHNSSAFHLQTARRFVAWRGLRLGDGITIGEM